MIHKKEACEVKRVFKKNQIIIAALAVMIAVAGYLNYSGKIFHEKDGGAEEANADLANQELLDISEEDIETVGDEIASNDSDVEGTPGEAVLTNGSAETTVAQAKPCHHDYPGSTLGRRSFGACLAQLHPGAAPSDARPLQEAAKRLANHDLLVSSPM